LKILVDAMLGTLARYLRILGYDTLYVRDCDDSMIIDICVAQERLLVTRDRELASKALKRGCKVMLITNEYANTPMVLGYLAAKLDLNLKVDFSKTRCPLCNAVLTVVESSKERLQIGLIGVDVVFKCFSCGNYYWKGSHWKKIAQCLEEALEWKKLLSDRKS